MAYICKGAYNWEQRSCNLGFYSIPKDKYIIILYMIKAKISSKALFKCELVNYSTTV